MVPPRELPAQLLKRIEFRTLRRLDGFLFGDYTGLFYGPSLDLAEVREYQPGDQVRRIDWNVTARSGTIHVRQYREEREIVAWLVVDLSPSMEFGTRRTTKSDLALEFAGLAAAVLARRGNKVGSIGFSDGGTHVAPLGSGRRQPLAVLQSLLGAVSGNDGAAGRPRTAGTGTLAAALEHLSRTLRRKALLFVISDFITSEGYGGEPPWERPLKRLALRHEVIAVHVSDPAERELPRLGELRLRDPETGREVWVDSSDPWLRREHARLTEERRHETQRALRSARADLLELSTDSDIVAPVVRFALARAGRR